MGIAKYAISWRCQPIHLAKMTAIQTAQVPATPRKSSPLKFQMGRLSHLVRSFPTGLFSEAMTILRRRAAQTIGGSLMTKRVLTVSMWRAGLEGSGFALPWDALG